MWEERRGAGEKERRDRPDETTTATREEHDERAKRREEKREKKGRKAGNELPRQRGQPVVGMWVRLSPYTERWTALIMN